MDGWPVFFLNQTYSCVAILRDFINQWHETSWPVRNAIQAFPNENKPKEIEKDDANQHFQNR